MRKDSFVVNQIFLLKIIAKLQKDKSLVNSEGYILKKEILNYLSTRDIASIEKWGLCWKEAGFYTIIIRLLSRELIESINTKGKQRKRLVRLSEKGIQFLKEYRDFDDSLN